MNNFKKEGFRKGGSGFSGKPSFGGVKRFGGGERSFDRGGDRGGRPSEQKELFRATCSSCQKSCEVPFRPSGDKPVYCRECFGDKRAGDDRGGERSESRGGNFSRDVRPFREERAAHREKARTPRDNSNEDLKRQIMKLEQKIDSILSLLKVRQTETVEEEIPSALQTETALVDAPKKIRKLRTEKVKAAPKKKVVKKKS